MRAMKLQAALFAVLAAAPALLAQDQTVRIHAQTVLDGTGKTLRNATIVVRGSKITSIDTGAAANATYELGQLTVLPGMIDVHAHPARVRWVQRVFGVDDGAHATHALRFGDDMLYQRRLARRFGAKYLGHSAARHAAHAERNVQRDGAGRNNVHRHALLSFAQLHDRAFAELLLDL